VIKKQIKINIEDYTFDEKTGLHFYIKTGKPFCTSCLLDKKIASPVKVLPQGWRCQLKECDKIYDNPDYKKQQTGRKVINHGTSGWVRNW
jgi:hypothetical protein